MVLSDEDCEGKIWGVKKTRGFRVFGRREKVGERWLWPMGFAPRLPTRLCLGRKGKEEKIRRNCLTSKREIRPEVEKF